MLLLIRCGVGLESICIWEIQEKLKNISMIIQHHQIKGHILLEIKDGINFKPKILYTLRCFERISLIIEQEKILKSELESKRKIENKLRNLFIRIFEKWNGTADFANDIKNLEKILEIPSNGKKELNLIIHKSIPNVNLGLNDSQIHGISQKIMNEFGFHLNLKAKTAYHVTLRISNSELLFLLDFPVHPGNFKPEFVHPTGLFPNFIFGLIISALKNKKQLKSQNQKCLSNFILLDPCMGYGAILAFFNEEFEFLKKSQLIPDKIINYIGIEQDPSIFYYAQKNLIKRIGSRQMKILNSDFDSVKILKEYPNGVDLVITQPPYGYSIEYSDLDLQKLYNSIFEWVIQIINEDGVFALITPREELLPITPDSKINSAKKWILLEKIPIKQHSIEVGIYIFKKKYDI